MSTSIYLVCSDTISTDECIYFYNMLSAVDINQSNISCLINEKEANVWMRFLGASVLDECDEEELERWNAHLKKGDAYSFFELTIGSGDRSMNLAVKIAKEVMSRWDVIVDDLYDAIYTSENIDEILAP